MCRGPVAERRPAAALRGVSRSRGAVVLMMDSEGVTPKILSGFEIEDLLIDRGSRD